jgi:four helix bundle protein
MKSEVKIEKSERGTGRDLRERTFEFAVRVTKLCRVLKPADLASRVIARQLLRAGTSIGANYEEAQASHSRADFACKCGIALKEAREAHYWLRLLAATDTVPQPRLADIIAECGELIAVLTTIVKKVKQPAI